MLIEKSFLNLLTIKWLQSERAVAKQLVWLISLSKLILCGGILLLFPSLARAHYFDLNAMYLTDSLVGASTNTVGYTFTDVAAGLNVTRKGDWTLGWSYGIVSVSKTGDLEATYSATEMGPRLGYFIDRAQSWSIFLTYYLQSTATYETSSASLEWQGTSIKVEMGFAPQVTESIYMGVKMIYYQTSLSKEFSTGNTFTDISYSRGIIYPAFHFSFRY